MVAGEDAYGKFKLFTTLTKSKCDNCRQAAVVIKYWPKAIKLPDGIKPEGTILGKNRLIGVTCGCYAKGHRQIARIDERMKSHG